jgi:type I restriction enzyme, S subunit
VTDSVSLRAKDLNDWSPVELGEIIQLKYGKGLKAADRMGGGIPVFGSGGVVGFHDAALVRGPGVVVGRKGNVGAAYWSEGDFYPIDTTYFVETQQDLRFIYYLLSTLTFEDSHAAVPGLSRETAYAKAVWLPPLEQQRLISATLRIFDLLIENNRRRIDLLEETARLLYREWIVNFRYPGHEDVSLVDSGLGPIPQNWEIRSFNEVADFINGFAFKSSEHWLEEGLPILKIKELKAGLGDDTPRYHGNDIDTKYFIDNGDVLFSWSAHLDAYVWAGGPGLLNQHLFVVKPYELSKLFVFHSLRDQMTEFRARAQGTTMKHIKRSALGEVFLRVPPPGIRQQFERTVSPMLDLQLELQSSNRLLTETRALLLPRLVSGDLDISDLDLSLEAVS